MLIDIRNLLNTEPLAAPHDRAFELTTGYEDFMWSDETEL